MALFDTLVGITGAHDIPFNSISREMKIMTNKSGVKQTDLICITFVPSTENKHR